MKNQSLIFCFFALFYSFSSFSQNNPCPVCPYEAAPGVDQIFIPWVDGDYIECRYNNNIVYHCDLALIEDIACNFCPADQSFLDLLSSSFEIYVADLYDNHKVECGYFQQDLVSCHPLVSLPVELTSFTADIHNEKVLLKWTTASETNNSHFNIQRSINASDFETIGVIDGNGTTDIPFEFYYVDENPLSGKSYYRLQQVDYSGESSLTDFQTIDLTKGKFDLNVYQNPGVTELVFDVEEATYALIQILDLNGRLIFKENRFLEEGVSRIEVDLPDNTISALQIYYGNKLISQKLVGDMY